MTAVVLFVCGTGTVVQYCSDCFMCTVKLTVHVLFQLCDRKNINLLKHAQGLDVLGH